MPARDRHPLHGAPYSPDLVRSLSVEPLLLGWLESARGAWATGADLVELIAMLGPGEAVRETDDLLAYWYHLGLVRPSARATPSPSQLFLGHGGRLRLTRGTEPPSWYSWTLCGPIWLRGSGG